MTKTGDPINERTQKTVQHLINAAYQARLAKCEEALERTFGKKEAEEYLDNTCAENYYYVDEVLDTKGILWDLKVPDLDVLVALGQANLKGLLNMCRRWYHSLNDLQKHLDVVRGGIAKDAQAKVAEDQIDETLYCTGLDSRWRDVFDVACESCPKRLAYLAAYHTTSPLAFTTSGRELIARRAEKIDPAGKPCFVFVDQPENEELVGKFLRNLRLEREKLEQRKKTVVQYVKQILKAKHDVRLQADLPPFPCYRDEDKYLQLGDLYLMYIYGKEDRGLPTGFVWVRAVDYLGQSPLICVEQDFTGKRSVLTVDNMEQEIRDLGFDQFFSMILGQVGPCVMAHNRIELESIDIGSSVVLKPWEVMALRENPEYAKIWVHSCFTGPNLNWEERDKFLQMILGEVK